MDKSYNKRRLPYIPYELVNMIAEYHDYDKYCKPEHLEKFQHALNDIISMGEIMPQILPTIAAECWGGKLPDYYLWDPHEEDFDFPTFKDYLHYLDA